MATDPSESEADLRRRSRNGDEEAFRLLFAKHLAELERRLARRLPPRLQRRFDVSDVVQETRLVAFARREDFELRGPNGFGRWIQGIGERKLGEAIRRHGRTAKRSAHHEVTRGRRVDTAAVAARGPTPSQVAVSHEVEERARKALATLAPDDQEVIRLTREVGLSLEEVAERMGRSREAVRKLCGRAVVRFAAAYDALGAAMLTQLENDLDRGSLAVLPFEAPWLRLQYGTILLRGPTPAPAVEAFLREIRRAERNVVTREQQLRERWMPGS